VPLEPGELRAAARRARGKAAGFSGWTGTELDEWPEEAWEAAAGLFNDMLEQGSYPCVWYQIRQTHILKPGTVPRRDGAWPVGGFRPISVECAILRLVGAVLARRQATREWCTTWATRNMCGGITGRGVADGILRLDQGDPRSYLLSLDMTKCFDYCQPRLVVRCLDWLGALPQVVQLCMRVWTGQQRYVAAPMGMLCRPHRIGMSIPQGDAFSPLGLNALLLGPLLILRLHYLMEKSLYHSWMIVTC
jgi:hypothetical protein